MTLQRRPALEKDTDFARTVHHAAYHDVVVRQFGAWDNKIQDTCFADDWSSAPCEILVWDGETCGYTSIVEHDDYVHVREIVVQPNYQGRGIGTQILQDAIKRAETRQVPVKLGALHQNRAVDLYLRLGFQETGRTETHVLMEYIDQRPL